jgi:predicted transcriptional regulator
MQHRGEIVKKAVHQSGYSITKLAIKLGKSRRWMYQMFDNSSVSLDLVLQIGEIIHYDFSDEIREFKKSVLIESRETNYISPENTVEFWKDKYLKLLEEYNALLLSK